MYEEELPLTGAAIAIGGVAFSTWWIAAGGAALVVVGTIFARLGRRRRAGAGR